MSSAAGFMVRYDLPAITTDHEIRGYMTKCQRTNHKSPMTNHN
ncbi:Uncharacterized protein dnm_074760 [Desulfonema magnum]|uniref:Uncharacterized protein n=1 Tax=Desulfonema magnum TaxID=45655 RepID=A0A975GRU8_9BACT|nr:Uncharacterized protein dnm_074760 [Desulfonema magnum]